MIDSQCPIATSNRAFSFKRVHECPLCLAMCHFIRSFAFATLNSRNARIEIMRCGITHNCVVRAE